MILFAVEARVGRILLVGISWGLGGVVVNGKYSDSLYPLSFSALLPAPRMDTTGN